MLRHDRKNTDSRFSLELHILNEEFDADECCWAFQLVEVFSWGIVWYVGFIIVVVLLTSCTTLCALNATAFPFLPHKDCILIIFALKSVWLYLPKFRHFGKSFV